MLQRRSFLQSLLWAVPAYLQAPGDPEQHKVGLVPAGQDREGRNHTVGVSATTYKVLTSETDGAMFVLEQQNHKKGGPNRHLHHGEDELFYVLEGQYVVEIGTNLFHLKAGDCVLGPRGVPHAWAFVGDSTGRLQLTYAPAGKMEAFFNQREQLGIKPGAYAVTPSDADVLRKFGMELVGPPLAVT